MVAGVLGRAPTANHRPPLVCVYMAMAQSERDLFCVFHCRRRRLNWSKSTERRANIVNAGNKGENVWWIMCAHNLRNWTAKAYHTPGRAQGRSGMMVLAATAAADPFKVPFLCSITCVASNFPPAGIFTNVRGIVRAYDKSLFNFGFYFVFSHVHYIVFKLFYLWKRI